MTDNCDCVFPEDGYEEVPPDEGFPDQCFDGHPNGQVCTREPGHEGPHIACNPWGEHRINEWEADDE